MKKKIIKIFLILVSVLLIANVTFATEVGDFIDGLTGEKPGGDVSTKIENASGQILTTVQYVGVAVAVIMLMVVAIKYFSAAPGEQAKLKAKISSICCRCCNFVCSNRYNSDCKKLWNGSWTAIKFRNICFN